MLSTNQFRLDITYPGIDRNEEYRVRSNDVKWNKYLALLLAAANNYEEVARRVLENPTDIDCKIRGNSITLDGIDVQFLEEGALSRLKCYHGTGNTPLHIACCEGYHNIASLFLQYSSDPNDRNCFGYTSLHLAAFKGYEAIALILLSRGADVNSTDDHGRTPMYIAIMGRFDDFVKLLLDFDASVEVRDREGWTALHTAAYYGNEVVFKSVLEKGADINDRNFYDRTALHIVCQMQHDKIVELLLQCGAEVNVKDKFEKTPLHEAAFNRSALVIKLLLEKNADIHFGKLDALLRDYVISCKEELDVMKHKIIHNNVVFYDLLTSNKDRLTEYAKNKNLMHALKLSGYRKLFPLYKKFINRNLRKGIKRKTLLKEGASSLYLLLKKLSYDDTVKISYYLSNKDLRNVIEASHLIPNHRNLQLKRNRLC